MTFRFLSLPGFTLTPAEQSGLEAFMIVFPTDLAPIVGQQVTLSQSLLAGSNAAVINARIDQFLARSGTSVTSEILGGAVTECDAVAQLIDSGGSTSVSYRSGVCSINQEDADSDTIGDACEPFRVPEPSSLWSLVFGGLWLAGFSRRRVAFGR